MTQDSEEWGPWIKHDGKGCPVPVGTFGQAELADIGIVDFRAMCGSAYHGPYVHGYKVDGRSCWDWEFKCNPSVNEVICYRIRKPRAMKQINALLQDLPQDVREKETQ